MGIARIGDVDIHYDIFGESGPAVLLVMGLGSRGDNWTPISRALAGRGFRAIQFDNRDVGRSSRVSGGSYEIADMAADAVGLLDHLGIPEARLVGISMGGMIAQEIAVRYPERLSRLVLLATSAGGDLARKPEGAILSELTALARGGDPAAAETRLAAFYRAITGPAFVQKYPELLDMAITSTLEGAPEVDGLLRQIQAISRFSVWDRLGDVRAPTLVLHGDADPLIPHENGELLARRIPGARLRTLPGVGHLVPLEAPLETYGALLDFLA
ncbi:alpha/beta fold hydrolase [Polyangium sorediatum]|uniref:Alpha/beta fold hydrolase n=1 Tax=Polyangium sorediatum TaxID=889274 RepID=A0ABT6NKU6_9BACT|nr:alpha/beta fold hydrolase [Polyangium sorediatum]MDI1428939.1 alpha/beta fold hydrolase [Polyangium sorediatum]